MSRFPDFVLDLLLLHAFYLHGSLISNVPVEILGSSASDNCLDAVHAHFADRPKYRVDHHLHLGGFLRKLVEIPAYHAHIAPIDEDTALGWLRNSEMDQAPMEPVVSEFKVALSKGALIVQELKRDLERVMTSVLTGPALLSLVQGHGYLSDWTHGHWASAEIELAQNRVWPRAP